MSEQTVGVETTLAEGNDSGSDIESRLEAYFAAQESQVDNSDETAEEQPVTEPEAVTEDDPEAEAETQEATEEAEEAAPEPEPEEEAADFDALERKDGEYLDADGLKEKFPRQSKAFYEEAARYSDAAKKGSEVISALGGEEFVPGASAIVKSLKEGNYRDTLAGIAETVGPEGLVYSVAEAMKLGFVEASGMAASDNPMQQHFGKTMLAVVDSVIEQRFGPDITINELEKLAQWKQVGWFEKIEKWAEESYVDHAELDELLEIANDPKLLAARNELKALEAQLAETKNKAQESTAKQQAEVENSFSAMAADRIGEVYNDVVLAKSPLRDLPTDTPEIKAGKALIRRSLIKDAVELFQSDTGKRKLLEGYSTGQSKTAVFQSNFASAINKAVIGTKADTAAAEKLVAQLYGGTRNAQLAKKQNRTQEIQPATANTRQPTQTTDFGKQSLDRDALRERFEQQLAATG